MIRAAVSFLILTSVVFQVLGQQKPTTDTTMPLHLLKPDYPGPYGIPKPEEVTAVLDRVYRYLDSVTPTGFVNEKTGQALTDYSKVDENTILKQGDFRIVSYEWGVTYAGMLLASEATGDPRFRDYVERRISFIADAASSIKRPSGNYSDWEARMPLRNLIAPRTLDDVGAMTAAMIKAKRGGSRASVQPLIDKAIDHIMNKQFRLKDGTLAR